jgi:hypothetical protein
VRPLYYCACIFFGQFTELWLLQDVRATQQQTGSNKQQRCQARGVAALMMLLPLLLPPPAVWVSSEVSCKQKLDRNNTKQLNCVHGMLLLFPAAVTEHLVVHSKMLCSCSR